MMSYREFIRLAVLAGFRARAIFGLYQWMRCDAGLSYSASWRPRGARDLLRALDGDATDGPAVRDVIPGYRFPEPGEGCLDELATVQLYWPAVGP